MAGWDGGLWAGVCGRMSQLCVRVWLQKARHACDRVPFHSKGAGLWTCWCQSPNWWCKHRLKKTWELQDGRESAHVHPLTTIRGHFRAEHILLIQAIHFKIGVCQSVRFLSPWGTMAFTSSLPFTFDLCPASRGHCNQCYFNLAYLHTLRGWDFVSPKVDNTTMCCQSLVCFSQSEK